ncbi:glutathione S-transferase family protein [Colwellia psychrerythraea]|uniref:Glutathione transferase n=1 Tax=Colwellia psychrerythraea TaxID=28229 RepID=A0A099L611_COLPS|nr:glutathione S-transferase family protein [Colwellia psychrerythraea]KGJ97567.1 Glutathione transferase [Colwellia psychrerythraea]
MNKAKSEQGDFRRDVSVFRNWITADGSAGPTGVSGFKAEKYRYHLYVSLACPWAHRTLIFRVLKQLEDYIDITVVDYLLLKKGWQMTDSLYGFNYLSELYSKSDSNYQGRYTVPILWDKQTQKIVSNESADIIRMFNTAFNQLTNNLDDYYPKHLQCEINKINTRVYKDINDGVYRSGFATTQKAYESATLYLFDALSWVETILSERRYLTGNTITEADWRLFATLIRFDAVYHYHFKCNKQKLADYPAIIDYVRELYQVKGVAETVDMKHIKNHYYMSHLDINPTGIVPLGPELNFMQPYGRTLTM